ncbi:MAG TPA: 3'-5' exonuclease [Candidatus Saccharimonadales bacterium]|jgi:DNA polymerase-3 subunit epsilon|nr:3'-5' exonuclease [Candidatus Saccharimonadales bacterium]
MVTEEEILQALGILAEHPDFRVLTRFRERPAYHAAPPGAVIHKAVFLDLETTGLDPAVAEIIELGATRFTFDEDGRIFTVGPTVQGYEQPSNPITPEITALTGITNDMVEGKVIESVVMDHLMDGVELVIAHNADYDRKIAERRWKYRFEHLPWACSYKQIDWKARGSIGSKLGNILMTLRGQFYDAHRAADDCLVGIDVLNHQLDGRTAMAELLDTTRAGVFRVYAHGAPFEVKDQLKARGFFWTGEKPWKRDFITREAADAEVVWLDETGFSKGAQIKRISSRHRYSTREESRAVPLTPLTAMMTTDPGPYA